MLSLRGVKYLGANSAILQRKCSPGVVGSAKSVSKPSLHSGACNVPDLNCAHNAP